MRESRPVMIVGAGPTGMTAAMELSRFGIPVRLVDRYKVPPDTSRALGVQSRTLELFFQRGLSEEMVRLGNRGFSTTIYGKGKALGSIDLEHLDSRFNFILLLAQSETERIFRAQLARQGVAIERETEMIAFSQAEQQGETSGVQVTLHKPDGSLEEVESSYLIDAEGAHSTVRHTLGLQFKGKPLPDTYALADLHLEGEIPEDQLSIFLSENGLLAVFPMGGHRFRIIATEKEEVASDAPEPDIPYMQTKWVQEAHIPVRLYDLKWSSRYRINSRRLEQLQQQRIFFGGDAAHVHSPAGGQGMNTGIQDMINLGWKLALVHKRIAKPELLHTYQAERLPIISTVVSTTERATDIVESDSPLVHTLIAHALPMALSLEAIQKKGAGTVSELQLNYRNSSLTIKSGASGALKAGDRVPDLRVGGHTLGDTLLSLLDPNRFTLYCLGDEAGTASLRPWADDWSVQSIAPPADATDAQIFMHPSVTVFGSSSVLMAIYSGCLQQATPRRCKNGALTGLRKTSSAHGAYVSLASRILFRSFARECN